VIPEPPPLRHASPGRYRVGPLLTTTIVSAALVLLIQAPSASPAPIADAPPPDTDTSSVFQSPEPTQSPILRASVSPEVEALRRDLHAAIPEWRSAEWSILVVSLDRGDTLFSVSPDHALAPASNMKLVTTAAAFRYLGQDFRFRTMVLSESAIVDGRLQGDLILLGTGDPGLSDRMYPSNTSVFTQLAKQLADAGVVSISGNIVGDGNYFDGPLLAPEWQDDDLNEWFAAPVSGLTFNENIVTLQISPATTVGAPPVVSETPSGAGLNFNNNAETVEGRPRPRLWLERLAPDAAIRIEGDIRSSGTTIWRRLTVADPVLFASRGFLRVLEEQGINVDGEAVSRFVSPLGGKRLFSPRRAGNSQPVEVLAEVESPPILEYLTVVNHVSHNLFAEAIFKSVGRIVTGEGSFQGGAHAVRDYLRYQVGVSPGTVVVRDGSGLSPSNAVAAGAFIRILQHIAASEDWDAFESTLPLAGRRRGLRRMYRTRAAGNLRAKTGTIDGVSALTGVVRSTNGERLLFSILANGVRSTNAAKRVEDRIGVRLAEFGRPPAPLPQATPSG
jgi:serine-type D-Ala-D-Ala carboxypeptidase/endopeptidase (penicillin-binding protein 4)